jgi:hypothetical protein
VARILDAARRSTATGRTVRLDRITPPSSASSM